MQNVHSTTITIASALHLYSGIPICKHTSSSASLLPVTLAQAQDGASCPSLQHYVDEQPYANCDIKSNGELCLGMSCDNESIGLYTAFFVRRCEDPVTVKAYVELYDEYIDYTHEFYYIYDQSETVIYHQMSYTGILERNATYLGFMVSAYETECINIPPKIEQYRLANRVYGTYINVHCLAVLCL